MVHKLVLAYDGTTFVGFQRQATGVSVQGLLEEALARIEGRKVTVIGAGRTDAGVHATGQVASVELSTTLDGLTLRRALNAVLPQVVRVLEAERVAGDFHARYAATGKTYEYRIVNAPVVPPFVAPFAWHIPYDLDLDRMREAAGVVGGTHDFSAFQSTGTDVRSTVRTVQESTVLAGELARLGEPLLPAVSALQGTLLVYRITGDGFLRHMVRALVGTLVEIGSGRFEPDRMARLLEGGSRGEAGPTAPAQGLCLAAVHYADPVS